MDDEEEAHQRGLRVSVPGAGCWEMVLGTFGAGCCVQACRLQRAPRLSCPDVLTDGPRHTQRGRARDGRERPIPGGNPNVSNHGGSNRPQKRAPRRNRREAEQLEQTAMHVARPSPFVTDAAFVGMPDARLGRVGDSEAREQDLASPLEIFGDRRLPERMPRPDVAPYARTHVVEDAGAMPLSRTQTIEFTGAQRT